MDVSGDREWRRLDMWSVEPAPRAVVFIDGVKVGVATQVNVSRDMNGEMSWPGRTADALAPAAAGPALVDRVEQDWSGGSTRIGFRGPGLSGEAVMDEVGISPQARAMGPVLGLPITIETTQEMTVEQMHKFRDFFETGDREQWRPEPGRAASPLELLDEQVEEVAAMGRTGRRFDVP